jgi:dolichol-phosphate mannosyltransferase
MNLTVVLPTYNEVENISKLICAIFDLPLPDVKVIVVDDNSPDNTGKVADNLARQYPGRIKVIHRTCKSGLGTAYITGFNEALKDGAEAIAQMDSDFSHPVDKLVDLMKAVENVDIALGSRYVPGGSLDERWPIWRKGLSWFANMYSRTILGLSMRDVTGGYRVYRRKTLQTLPLERVRSNGYVFQVEIAYLAQLLGLKVKEVPIYFAERRQGHSKMSLRIQLEAAFRVWQLPGLYKDLKGKIAIR